MHGMTVWLRGMSAQRFSLSLGETAGVRARGELTCFGNARREREKKSGRKVVTSGNDLALTQAAKKAKRCESR